MADDWHLVHLGSRAVGGVALVFVEATAVTPEGRITPGDMGIWSDEHVEPLARIARFVHRQGAVAGIQLAHAGRKASCDLPWKGGAQPQDARRKAAGRSSAPARSRSTRAIPSPSPLDEAGIDAHRRRLRGRRAPRRLRPVSASSRSTRRTATCSTSSSRRCPTTATTSTAAAWRTGCGWSSASPSGSARLMPDRPAPVRADLGDRLGRGRLGHRAVGRALRAGSRTLGVDLIDCSSGALVPRATIPVAKGFQVPFARRIREEAGIMTGAVGMITEPTQANEIITGGDADLVFLARELLREPYWAIKAAHDLGVEPTWPIQYGYAVKRRAK